MVLVDEGTGEDIQFGHTNYYTGEGRPVTQSENQKERYINSELSVEERHQICKRDSSRRNLYAIYLLNENNIQIVELVYYNPFTEDLSIGWGVIGNNSKKALDITAALDSNRYL